MFPSVTQLLAPYSGIDELKRRLPAIIERAAARGTAVHGYCEAAARRLMPMEVFPEWQGYLDSFFYWFQGVEEVVETECRLFDMTLGFHGQFDILCRMRGDRGLSLWDYKTPEVTNKTWPAQIAAYRHLARIHGYETIRGGMIRLRKSGRLPLINEYTTTERRDWNVFVSVLNVYTNLVAPVPSVNRRRKQ